MSSSVTTSLTPDAAVPGATTPVAQAPSTSSKAVRLTYLALLALAVIAPLLGLYPVFVMKALCFALFACAFNLLLGFTGLLSFGHAAFFGFAAYVTGYVVKVQAWPPSSASWRAPAWRLAGHPVRPDRDPPPGHLLRDDHAGPGADGVLRLPAGALHRRRRRLQAVPARHAVRGAAAGLRHRSCTTWCW
jgi:hypothetical protein